jgi:ABC-type antimicrobial peptide transport system permease subunit
MSSQLYGVGKWDPLVLSLAVISLCICAFTAAFVPATRAASINPMKALRTE